MAPPVFVHASPRPRRTLLAIAVAGALTALVVPRLAHHDARAPAATMAAAPPRPLPRCADSARAPVATTADACAAALADSSRIRELARSPGSASRLARAGERALAACIVPPR